MGDQGKAEEQEQQEREETFADLDVPEEDGKDVKGGASGEHFKEVKL